MQKYIKNKKLFNKFNKAFIEGKLILINGATGVGKTAFIEEALKDEDYCYFSIKENYESITCNKDICVIDDFQFIIDKEYLLKEIVYIANTVKHAIIISRSNMSEYFMDAIATKGILTIGEKDLFFNEEMLYELFDNSISKEEMEIFFKNSMGFPLITLHLANKVKEGSPLTPELLSQSQTVYIQRLKTAVFDNINPEVLNFLLQVSVVDEFNIELAVAITLNNRSKHLVSKAAKYGNFITFDGETYTIRNVMLFALRSLSYHYYSLKEYNEFKSNAAHYYEKIGELEKALKLYEKIDNFASIKRILVHNSMKNPAIGDFKLLRPYYEKLTKEEIMANPILACGMSMLYSLFLDVEKSEYYYDLIKNKLQNATSAEQIELTNIISYLDVALPQRGTNDIFSLLGSQKQMDYSKNSTIPFALTANTPSIINGGKDFTIYIKKYEPLIEKYSNLMNLSMGKDYSRGLISTIKAECMYELGEDQSALVRNIVKANMEVDNSLVDYHFVLARLSSMLSLERGDIENAIKSIDKFLYSLPKEKEKQYIDNISSLKALIYIYSDNQEEVNNWLSAQSIDIVNFYSLNKNNYLVRAYAYIYFEKYAEAYEIIQKLQIYARLYHRSYILAETLLLQAIIEFNVDKEYIDSLFEGLSICEERGLYRLPSRLGISLDKMIYEQRNKLIEMGISNKFLLTLNPLLLTYSTRYPLFLSKEENFIPNLSKTGVMILQLQSRGYSLNMIADRLCINLETIRYHSKQNYKKLGASGSAEAVAIAKKYGII